MTPSFSQIVADLESALARPLPASAAHALVAPQPRRLWPPGFNLESIRNAAGLLLVFPVDDRAHVPLTVRAETLERHSGQVSLPGGVVEPGETFEHAALREAHEEISVRPDEVRILGRLTPLDIHVSAFRLHPVVGFADHRPPFSPAAGEVARILEVALDALMAPACLMGIERQRDGGGVLAPSFCIGSDQIWGATAMALAELLVLLGWQPGK